MGVSNSCVNFHHYRIHKSEAVIRSHDLSIPRRPLVESRYRNGLEPGMPCSTRLSSRSVHFCALESTNSCG